MSEWGDRIARRMVDSGLNQTSLAEACGIKPPSVNDWVSGKTKMIDGMNLVRAARALGTSPDWIMTGRGDGESQATRLDPVILAESIAALRQVSKRRGWSYDPELHAESTCYAYELWQLLPSQPSTADVIDIGERIAERLRKEMEGADGSNQSGSGSGAGADDRSGHGGARTGKARAKAGAK